MTNEEQWRPVVGYEGYYEVSDQGRVRSLARLLIYANGRRHSQPGCILKPGMTGGRYLAVNLYRDGREYRMVHTLVARAFLGPRPDGLFICHNNGDSFNNRLQNLRYDTPSSNNFDRVRHGNNALANRTHCKYGHEFTAENTYRWSDGARRCKECNREKCRRQYAAKKAAA